MLNLYFVLNQCKLNFERNLKEVVVVQLGLMILNDETLSIISFISPKREIQMFDINRFEYRISLFAQKSLMGTTIIVIYSLHEYIIYRILDKIVLLTRRSRQFISTSFSKLLWPIAKSILFKYFYFRIVFYNAFSTSLLLNHISLDSIQEANFHLADKPYISNTDENLINEAFVF